MLRVCFNCYGNYTTDSVFQWDLNHVLLIDGIEIDGNAPTVHFCNKKSESALVVQSEFLEQAIKVSIPNQLLQEPYDIIAYIHTYNDEKGKTIEIVNIPLIKRAKPDDYVFTENIDIQNFERLESDITDFMNTTNNTVAGYKTEMDTTLQMCRDSITALQLVFRDMDGGTPTTEDYNVDDDTYNGGYPV